MLARPPPGPLGCHSASHTWVMVRPGRRNDSRQPLRACPRGMVIVSENVPLGPRMTWKPTVRAGAAGRAARPSTWADLICTPGWADGSAPAAVHPLHGDVLGR